MGSEDGKRLVEQGNARPALQMYFDWLEKRAIPVSEDAPFPVLLYANAGNVLSVDEVTGALITVDYAHHEVHEGRHFAYANAQDIATSTTVSFTIVTPDTERLSHFGFEVNGELEWDLQIFEGATNLGNVGTPVSNPAVINSDRNSANVNGMVINGSPTLAPGSKGTLIWRAHAGSGRSIGGEAGTGNELKLKRNTIYWVDISNVSNSAANFISWVVEWYEHIDKN